MRIGEKVDQTEEAQRLFVNLKQQKRILLFEEVTPRPEARDPNTGILKHR